MDFITIVLIITFLYVIFIHSTESFTQPDQDNQTPNLSTGTCGISQGSCGATAGSLDPIMDPKYNILEVIKNTILLEDHLNQSKKRCNDCICKHFLTIISYLCEGINLAGTSINDYPHLENSLEDYTKWFEKWKADKRNPSVLLEIASDLRKKRKVLIHAYVLNE